MGPLGKYGHIKFNLCTTWTYRTYAVYNMDPSNLYCLWKGLIKHILFMEGTHQILTTVTITCVMLCLGYVYRVVGKAGWAHTVNNVSLLGLSYIMFMEETHKTYIVYGRNSSNLYCLWKGLIKLILFMEGAQVYWVYHI
jgi:hypothetical protein